MARIEFIIILLFYRYQSGMTSLILASARGHYEIVKLLIGKGANIEAQSQVCTYLRDYVHRSSCPERFSIPVILCHFTY